MAKQRTLHVFNDNGKSIPVLLRERDGNVAVFEAAEAIPVGVYVECLGPGVAEDCGPTGPVLSCRAGTLATGTSESGGPGTATHPLLEISVEFNGRKSIA